MRTGKPFERAHVGVRALKDAARTRRLGQRGSDFFAPALGSRRQALQHDDVAIAVGNDAGKSVRFAVQDPARRVQRVEKRTPLLRRVSDAAVEERGIDRRTADRTTRRARGSATPENRRHGRERTRRPRRPSPCRPRPARPRRVRPRRKISKGGAAAMTSRARVPGPAPVPAPNRRRSNARRRALRSARAGTFGDRPWRGQSDADLRPSCDIHADQAADGKRHAARERAQGQRAQAG